jgi:glutathione S-transferase
MMTLYFSRNFNPRLAVATARYLDAPVTYEFAAPLGPGQQERFRRLNPNLRVPILVEGEASLWEADAIACRLSRLVGSDFWRQGEDQPDMIRWLSWAARHFVVACDKVHFERITKRRYGLGPTREDTIGEGLAEFGATAAILEAHLAGRRWLLGDAISYADFRMGCVLPDGNPADLPVGDYPELSRWNAQLEAIEAWRDPFAGLGAPGLPPVDREERGAAAHT